ncbi:MAG: ABC transporter ATP-binding protein [Thermodesulfobacteriota bacterium]
MTQSVLVAKGLCKRFGGLRAVDGLDLELHHGEILGLIGPNGAGKTVTFNMISGVYSPDEGEIFLGGRRIHGLPPHRVAALGLGRTFQIVKPFSQLTVLENVIVALGVSKYGSLKAIWGRWDKSSYRKAAMEKLEMVGLAEHADRKAGLLPLGNLRKLEIARALCVTRSCLLLDESFSGLRQQETAQLEALVRDVRRRGISVLLIEHNMRVAMGLSDRVVVLDHGRKLCEGSPQEVSQDPRVIEAYLGEVESRDAP